MAKERILTSHLSSRSISCTARTIHLVVKVVNQGQGNQQTSTNLVGSGQCLTAILTVAMAVTISNLPMSMVIQIVTNSYLIKIDLVACSPSSSTNSTREIFRTLLAAMVVLALARTISHPHMAIGVTHPSFRDLTSNTNNR